MAETNELLLKSVTGNMPGVIFTLNPDGIFTLSDGKGLGKFGLQPGQVVGLSAFEVYKDFPEICASIRRALKGDEHHSTTKVGELFFETWYTPTKDEKGKINGVLGIANDVTEQKIAEQTMRENEDRYQTVFNATPIMFWLKDAENRTLRINQAAAQLEGVNPKDVEGRSAYDLYPKEQAEAFYQDDLQVIRSGKPKLGIVEQHRAVGTGEVMWLETGKVPVHNDKGKTTGVLAFAIDITKSKQAEQSVRESEERQRQILETSPVATLISRIADGTVLYANEEVGKLFKDDVHSLMGKSTPNYYADPNDRLVLLKTLQDVGHVGNKEICFKRTDGETFWALVSIHPLRFGDEQNALLTSVTDITERKQAEAALHDNQQFLELVLNNIPQSVFWKDKDLRYLGCNSAFAEDAGCSINDVIGKTDYDMPWKDTHAAQFQADGRRVLESGQPKLNYEESQMTASGELTWLRTSLIPLLSKTGDAVALLGLYEDITERKRTEQIIRENEDRFRRFTEATVEGLVFHEQGKIVDVNPAAVELFGFSDMSGLIGRNLLEFILPESHQMVLKQMQLESVSPYEIRCVHKNGTVFPVETSTRAYKYGERIIRASSIRDITERKKLEKQIQESLERRGSQIETTRQVSQEISAAPDLDSLFLLVVTLIKEHFNYYHAQIFRYDEGQDAVVLVSGYGEAGKKMLAAGHKLVMGHGVVGTAAQTGKSILAADTTQDPDWRPNPDLPDTKGELAVPIKFRDEILGILDVQSDIANALTQDDVLLIENLASQIALAIDHTRTTESLRQNEIRLSDAMDAAKLGYWEYDVARDIFTFNDQFYAIFHTTAEQEGGYELSSARYAQRFVHPDDLAIVGGEIERALKSTDRHYSRQIDHRCLYADGNIGYVSVRINIDRDEQGNIVRYYGANQDITDRKKTEMETQETLRELERLYRSMSQSGWATYQNEMQAASSYTYDNLKIEEKSIWASEIATAVETRTTLKPEESNRPAIAPLSVRGEVIGALGITGNRELSDEDISMLESIAEQVALALESARLFGQTQQALNQANTFRQLVNATTQGIGMSNMQSKMVYANEALVKIFGEENAEQIIGKEITHYYPGHLRDYFAEQVLGTVMQKDTWTGEMDVSSQTGKDIPIINNVFLVKDDNGTPQFVANVITDITERKQAEQSLRRQNEYLATAAEVGRLVTSTLDLPTLFERTVNLLQSSFGYYHVAIFTVDDSGFSASLREATGEAGRLMKKQKHSIPVGSKSVVGSVTLNGITLVVNDTALDPLHRPNPLLLETRAEAGIPLKIGSRVIGTLDIQAREINAFLEDDIAILETLSDQISIAIDNARSYEIAQKAADELRETDRIRSQFLANMSHELRTPLNSIIGFSRVILKGIDGPITDQQNQDLSAIYNSGQHLLGLINDILDLSKIEAGKMELSTEEMSIMDTITSVMSTALGLIKDKPIKLKQEIEPDLPTIRADPMRLRQVLLNLISNAAKFTEEGSITVTAKLHASATGTREIMVGVTDTGPGINLEDQKKLFLAFSQVDSSATRKSGGTGLGLSICQRLIDMHGGKIGVHSAEGKGSTFYFTVPTYQQPSMESSTGEGKIILCIDDDPQVISLYERYLKPQGFQVIPLTNAANARDTVKRIKPYAVTLDIMMPGIDGWQVLEDLKSDPETRSTPVIVCSIVEEDEKGFSLGAADYLVKPISETDLVTALNRMGNDGNIKDILVIDDSPDDLRLMGKVVTEHGQFRPILAEGGEKGWEILITERPQAVILDLFMPGLDGFGILERLRTTPELRDIPVIVVSGMDLTPEQKKQLENLGQQLLQKGMLSEQELFTTLEKALKRLESKGKQG